MSELTNMAWLGAGLEGVCVSLVGGGPGHCDCKKKKNKTAWPCKCLHTSLPAAPCSLDAATGAAAVAWPSPEPTRLSPGPRSLLWWHCALIRSRSWASSIPAPSSSVSSHPPAAAAAAAAAVAANRASQEDARCSWKEQAACTQPTSRKGRERKRGGGGKSRKGRIEVEMR